ncbi:MAG: cache domain-containing protein [Acidobacteriota bacterium]
MAGKDRRPLWVIAGGSALVIFLLGVSLTHTYRQNLRLAKDLFSQHQSGLARQTAFGIEQTLELLVRELEHLAVSEAAKSLDFDRFETLAEDSFRHLEKLHVNDIALLDSEGIARVNIQAHHLIGVDFSFRDYFKKAKAAPRSTAGFELITFKGADAGQKGIVVSKPFLAEDGEFGGVVVCTTLVSELIAHFATSDFLEQTAWVMDDQGTVLFHPEVETGTPVQAIGRFHPMAGDLLTKAEEGISTRVEYISQDGCAKLGWSHPIRICDQRWTVVVVEDVKAVKSLVTPLSWDLALLGGLIVVVLISGSVTVLVILARWNKELGTTVSARTLQLVQSKNQIMKLASDLSIAEERERRRLACEIHDHIGQSLAVVRIQLGVLRREAEEPDQHLRIDRLRELVKDTIRKVQTMTFELCPFTLNEVGLVGALEWLADEMTSDHELVIGLTDDGQPKPLSDHTRNTLYQATRELLINIVKHSDSEEATVCIRRVNGTIEIIVTDQGRGFDPALVGPQPGPEGRFGLFSVRERMALIDGWLSLRSKPFQGTAATLVAPLEPGDTTDGE